MIFDDIQLELEPPIISEDPEEFLKKLEENYLFNLGLICPMNTLPNIVSALDYTLPDPHVYVITDAIANDYALEAGVIAAAKKKNATVRNRRHVERKNLQCKMLSFSISF